MTNENKKNFLIPIESLTVSLASPEKIRRWAERTLPSGKVVGQVMNSQTLNYKTFKPETGGLFCETIFGPIRDFRCGCGKAPMKDIRYCPECGVEFTSSRIRRYRLGYISLATPVAHVWYFKGSPSYVAHLLGLKKRTISGLFYCTQSITGSYEARLNYFPQFTQANLKKLSLNDNSSTQNSLKSLTSQSNTSFFNYQPGSLKKATFNLPYYCFRETQGWVEQTEWQQFQFYIQGITGSSDFFIPTYQNYFEPQVESMRETPVTGSEPVRRFLNQLDLNKLEVLLRRYLPTLQEEIDLLEPSYASLSMEQLIHLRYLLTTRSRILRRIKIVRNFRRSKARPEWMLLSILPVLPPDLRPIIEMGKNQVAVSDLNKLYQKVLFRNQRVIRHKRIGSSLNKSNEMRYAQRLLQEAVDALLENGRGGAEPISAPNGRPLKSLSDMLKGKKGRFRQNLLGKRVDYSARSVIVVGPQLRLHECGLPKEMALELFQPFVIRRLIRTKIVRTVLGAKKLIATQDPIIWETLQNVMENHPILLNRAPTLHRLGIQAFLPKMVLGRAILLHPLVCSAFNADFDGDQMAVHVPLSLQARAEAFKLMWSRNNLLSPATGQPILGPSQDMVLGSYYLTTENLKLASKNEPIFYSFNEVLDSYQQKILNIHNYVWVKWGNRVESDEQNLNLIETRIDANGFTHLIFSNLYQIFDNHNSLVTQYVRTTVGRILMQNYLYPIFHH
jgi:DNA-directed RNA polymerase subunit beta'